MRTLFSSKTALDRAFEALLGREIQKLNTHLPKQRRPLGELLKVNDPAIEAVDGSSILLKTSELNELGHLVPQEYHGRLRLPIIVIRRMDLGKSIYTVAGERVEEFIVKKILGMTGLDYHQMYADQQPNFLYKPQIFELMRRFHSLVVIGFGIPRELADYAPKRD